MDARHAGMRILGGAEDLLRLVLRVVGVLLGQLRMPSSRPASSRSATSGADLQRVGLVAADGQRDQIDQGVLARRMVSTTAR